MYILDLNSNSYLKIVSLLVSRPQTRARFEIPFHKDEASVVKIPAKRQNEVAFDVAAIVDPVSRGAQKLGPILQVLQDVLNCNIRMFLNSVEKNSDMPVKRYKTVKCSNVVLNIVKFVVSIVLCWNRKYSLSRTDVNRLDQSQNSQICQPVLYLHKICTYQKIGSSKLLDQFTI